MSRHMKHFLAFSILATFSVSLLADLACLQNKSYSNVVYAASAETLNETSTPRADILEWRYKKINGKVYKRLYNASTNTWVGGWKPLTA